MQALSHHWSVLHSSWNGGRMDSWIAAHRAPNKESAPLTMGYLTREDLPFYYALADAFTLCDGYHASVMGPTHPNRYFLMTGSIDAFGKNGGPATNNKGRLYSWETYPERLERAVAATGRPARRLVSGAGHDSVVLSGICPVAMLLVRCAGGISHDPRESVEEEDVAVALDVLERVVREW